MRLSRNLPRVTAALAVSLGLAGFTSACKQDPPVFKELRILHTNDIHSHLHPPRIDPFGLGGVSRLATVLETLRAKDGDSITLDAGDWSEGTWYYDLDEGANLLGFLDQMGYDAACLGNHDFLNGPDQVIQTVNAAHARFPVLAANIDTSNYAHPGDWSAAVPASTVLEVDGMKVGVIGLTTYDPTYFSYISPVKITEPIEVATQLALSLRSKVDVLLLLSHNSFDVNTEIAKVIPGLDGVISGHSHVKTPQPVMVSNFGRQIPVVEAGAWAEYVGELDLKVDPVQHIVKFDKYALFPVSPDTKQDLNVYDRITAQDDALDAKYSDDVTRQAVESDMDLAAADAIENPLGNLVAKAYRESLPGADLGLEEVSLTSAGAPKGPITLMELHDLVPHIYNPATGKEWTVHAWNARGSDLLLILDIFYTLAKYFPFGNPLGFLAMDGAQITWTPSRSVAGAIAIESLTIGGQPVDLSRRYLVALTDGLLLGLNTANSALHLGIDLSQLEDTGVEGWRALLAHTDRAGRITVPDIAVGTRARPVGLDLAVHDYGIAQEGDSLVVQVYNHGLTALADGAATLRCSTGFKDDAVSYNTSAEVWTPLGSPVPVPAMDAGGVAELTIAWPQPATGLWPVQCVVNAQGDTYAPDDLAQLVINVEN